LARKGVTVPEVYERIHRQQRQDRNKIYSVHEPEVSCIAKGKAHRRYEFGSKTAVISTERGNWLLGVKVFTGNPYDGHTLAESLAAISAAVREKVKRVLVDLGYRRHDETRLAVQVVPRRRKGLTDTEQQRCRRRNAIEPLIGHAKAEHRLERNRLKGLLGDEINAILAVTGLNFRKLLRGLLAWLDFFGGFWAGSSRSPYANNHFFSVD
jgi:IS5 family transposase